MVRTRKQYDINPSDRRLEGSIATSGRATIEKLIRKRFEFFVRVITIGIVLVSCSSNDADDEPPASGGPPPTTVDSPPTVNAGVDIEVKAGQKTVIRGIAQSTGGHELRYSWRQVSGDIQLGLQVNGTTDVEFTAPIVTIATQVELELVVTDSSGRRGSDRVIVNIIPNTPPMITSVLIEGIEEVGEPLRPSRDISIIANYVDADSSTIQIKVEISLDGGRTWAQAELTNGSASTTVSTDRPFVRMRWNALSQIGFRERQSVLIRVTPSDESTMGNAFVYRTPVIDNRRAALNAVQSFSVYYGAVDSAQIERLQRYDLVVLHPSATPQTQLFRQQLAQIQRGRNVVDVRDDVIVMCYVSVGEDLRTTTLTDAQMANDPRFLAVSSAAPGPRVDPRGSGAYTGGEPLDGIDPIGALSPAGGQFASWYLDDVSVAQGVADGLPDRNPRFGGAYVNMGDPDWFDVIDSMTVSNNEPSGFRELLTDNYGLGLSCDGVFMDTVDTAAPNSFGAASKFEWTAPGAGILISALRQKYPGVLVMQNRGLFYFNPNFSHYRFNGRSAIDALLFESYRMDSSDQMLYNPVNFCQNKREYMPKIMAEAGRVDGFRVFSLGYAEGPDDPVTGARLEDVLRGLTLVGREHLLNDLIEAEQVAGFRHYLTNASLDLLNDFVFLHRRVVDIEAPVWSSTFNDRPCSQDDADALPTPRIGIRAIFPRVAALVVEWDVALDQSGVEYTAYYQTKPFDFNLADPLGGAMSQRLTPSVPADYRADKTSFPFEDEISGLESGRTYYVLIRARDLSVGGVEDTNTVVLEAVPN